MPDGVWTGPGSDHARARGCVCPVVDNVHGDPSLARDRGGYIVRGDCPLHGNDRGSAT